MFVRVHGLIKEVQKALDDGDRTTVVQKWKETQDEIYKLPNATRSQQERFRNVVYSHLNGQHAGPGVSLDHLDDLMARVKASPQFGEGIPYIHLPLPDKG